MMYEVNWSKLFSFWKFVNQSGRWSHQLTLLIELTSYLDFKKKTWISFRSTLGRVSHGIFGNFWTGKFFLIDYRGG